jgi:hypothetical protein
MKAAVSQTILSILLGMGVYAQGPGCPGAPADLGCVVRNAQYTILGTVVSNDQARWPVGSSYNATIRVGCVFASNDPKLSNGAGLIGQDIAVENFGAASSCPRSISEATVNATRIFHVFVRSIGPPRVFSVVDICSGGRPNTPENLQALSTYLAANAQYAIEGGNRGPAGTCSLPAPPSPSSSSIASAAPKPTESAPSKNSADSSFQRFSLGLATGFFLLALAALR